MRGSDAQADWQGNPRNHDTRASITDPDARRYKKSDNTPAVTGYPGHILIENRSGLVVGAVVGHADGRAERMQALRLLERTPGRHPKTVGADKAYDPHDFVAACRACNATPYVARHVRRWGGSAIDGRTRRDAGHEVSQVMRKRIEEHFGWGKTAGRIRQTVCRGLRRGDQHFTLTMTASNLACMARILFAGPQGAPQ